ncbi:MAG: hypothetical protein NZ480_01900, partial [Bdellovibrionaceae bacterium]|nr:hypothetical protein [Pseudobdellovibrionaceae bacterium]
NNLKNLYSMQGLVVLFVTLIGSVVGVILPMIVFTIQSKNQDNLWWQRRNVDWAVFLNNLRRQLENPLTCPGVIGGNTINALSPGDINTGLRLIYRNASGAPLIVAAGFVDPGSRIQINDVQAIIVEPRVWVIQHNPGGSIVESPRIVRFDRPSQPLRRYSILLRIVGPDNSVMVQNEQVNINGTQVFGFSHIRVNLDPSHQIVTCHGLFTDADICEEQGGAYDSSAAMNATPHHRCHPDKQCWIDPRNILSTPVYTSGVPPLPTHLCNGPYQPTWMGRVGGNDLWKCLWCNDGM